MSTKFTTTILYRLEVVTPTMYIPGGTSYTQLIFLFLCAKGQCAGLHGRFALHSARESAEAHHVRRDAGVPMDCENRINFHPAQLWCGLKQHTKLTV